ncbi:MAG TPA: transglycosylase domain-containing protein [Bryobacteraceae bacterium]|nr:transglycosylase domain-containing protein [Bryobacteraceae bacterium]
MDRIVEHRLKAVMAERVVWNCEGCRAKPLIPVTGQPHQPRAWASLKDIPQQLIDSVIAVEDKRFYKHHGIDLYRTLGAAYIGVKHRESPRGTSTLTQQLSRTLFTSRERTLTRKAKEGLFALALERRLKKKEILELYLNTVPFGNAGPYEIVGVADGALAFTGKNIADVNVADIALIAGVIQRPSYLNPRSHPEAANRRRDLVLKIMRKAGVIDAQVEAQAVATPVRLAELPAENGHYLQLAARELRRVVNANEPVETTLTLDARLQQLGVEAVSRGVDMLNRKAKSGARIEAALVALDPRTGAVKALVGGSSFAASQVNRALARRQPGSVFKPFVYAAAMEYGSRDGALGPYSEVNDIPRTFFFNGKVYAPRNYSGEYQGRITLQEALNRSLNIPAVRVAEAVGYSRVATLARNAGLEGVAATPSAALGSYEVSPLALAGAYTAFTNQGMALKPYLVERVRGWDGNTLYEASPKSASVMRPETAQMLTNMLRGVVLNGTAYLAGRLPFAAAGKTGTDDDGWFVGFTDRLLCVIWVGYDDNRDLGLQGATSALPIWIDFMSRAYKMSSYRFANRLPGPPAQMYGSFSNVDRDPPPDAFTEVSALDTPVLGEQLLRSSR